MNFSSSLLFHSIRVCPSPPFPSHSLLSFSDVLGLSVPGGGQYGPPPPSYAPPPPKSAPPPIPGNKENMNHLYAGDWYGEASGYTPRHSPLSKHETNEL